MKADRLKRTLLPRYIFVTALIIMLLGLEGDPDFAPDHAVITKAV